MSAYTATRFLQEINARPAYLAAGAELESVLSDAVRAIGSFRVSEAQGELTSRMQATVAAYGLGPLDGRKPFAFAGGVAVVPIHGVLINRFAYTTGYVTGYDFIRAQVAAAVADPDVKRIALDIHSVGGTVAGCPETFRAIRDAGGRKPVVAVVDSHAYSAAYYLAVAASRVVLTPSGQVGSIGVVAARYDMTRMAEEIGLRVTFIHAGRHKLDGHPLTEMTDDERGRIQASVDAAYAEFVAAVVEGRGLSAEVVRDTEAGCFDSRDALHIGLVTDILPASQAVLAAYNEDEDESMTEPELAAVRAEAAAAERSRVAGILSAEEAVGRPKLARHLATNTGLSVEEARGLMAAAATETAAAPALGNPLEAVMNEAGTPNVGPDPAATALDTPEARAAAILAAYGQATGTKFN